MYAAALNCCAHAVFVNDHVHAAEYWSVSLLAFGRSHEFAGIYDQAKIEFEEIRFKATDAVSKFLDMNAKGLPGRPLPVIP